MIRSRGAVPGQGAAPGALCPESRGEGARADGLADDGGDEGSMGGRRRQVTAQGGRFEEADGAGGCIPWPELRVGSRADVGRLDVRAQYLCSPMGAGKEGEYAGSMEGKWQQGRAADEGSEGIGVAGGFPGSELQVGSEAGVARADATVDDCDSGGLRGSERQQGGMACGSDGGRADATNCFLRPELLTKFWADVDQESATADGGADGGSVEGRRQQDEAVQGDGAGGAGAASCFLGSELCGGVWADVGLPVAGARHLCGLVGTDRSSVEGDDYVGSMGGGRRHARRGDGWRL